MLTIEKNILKNFLMSKYNFPEIVVDDYEERKQSVQVEYRFVETQSECTSTVSYIELVNYLSEELDKQIDKNDIFESEVID